MLRRTWTTMFFVLLLYVLLSIFANYWLIKKLPEGVIYIYGTLPIHQPFPYIPFLVWCEILSTITSPIPSSHLISNIDFLDPNLAWLIHEILLPIIGGFLVYLFLREIIVAIKGRNIIGIAPITTGILYELILLAKYTDFWIKGFLAIEPSVPLFALITFKAIRNKNWRKAYVSLLLVAVFLSALYDWRFQMSGIMLMIAFILGMYPLSSILKVLKEKNFWMIFFISFSVWSILWLVPHSFGVRLNLLSHTRGIPLPVIVGDYSFTSVFGLYAGDNKILLIAYFMLICLAFSSLLMYGKNKVVLIASILVICVTLITWEQSPLKVIHYYLTLLCLNNIDIGVLFRTHKLFTGITLPLIISLFGLSLYKFLSVVESKNFKTLMSFLVFLLIGSIATQVVITSTLRQVTIIPEEYFQVSEWLKPRQGLYRILWLPRTGKYCPDECPVWLKTEGWGALETSLGLRTYYYYGKPMEYLYPFLLRLLENNKTRSAGYILAHLGVKYIALHDDYLWEPLRRWTAITRKVLDTSPYFRLQTYTEHIFIYENLLTKEPVHVATVPIIVDGGLRILASLIETLDNINFSKYAFFFTDLPIPKEVIYYAPIVVTDSVNDLKFNLLTNLLISEGEEEYILVPSFFTKGIKKGKWHPFFIDNPHHAEWEVFYTWHYLDASFENSFKFNWGFVGSQLRDERLEIPFKVKGNSNYTILIRYLENEKGGEIEVGIDGKYVHISTKGPGNCFRWFVANFTIKKDYNTIIIRNIKGRNAINIIVILPYEKFFIFSKEVKEILNWKKIILLRDLGERHITIFNTLNIDAITVQSIEYKDGMYVLDVLTETEQVGVGITIPEQYHGGWVAFVDESQEILSTPHTFVNNFWVTLRDRGSHKIRIEFVPQKTWIIIYTVNGLLTFLILTFCLLYLFYDQRKSGQRV